MHFGTYENETQWIPFPHEPMDALQHPLNSEDIEYSNVPSQDALDDASPQYMKMLASGSEGMEWARDKTVLFVGELFRHPSSDKRVFNFPWFRLFT